MMKTILLIALVWILIAPKISDAQSPISITATLKWEINQELCPTTGHCGKIIRLSNDGQSLYILMVSSRQLYVIDGANQITQYDLSLVPGIEYEHFDYVPLDDDTILFLDPSPTAHALYSYHLSTATLSKFLPAHGFAACTSGINPPPRSFMRPLFSSHLLTCGTGSSDPNKIRNVSIVDLEMETIEEIAALEGMPRGRFEPWRRVTLGHDDAVYMQPFSLDLVRQYVTDFNSRYLTTEFILRRTAHQLDWTVIEITQRSVRENGGTATIGQLIGVDKQSNLYFYNSWSEADVARAQYTKTTSSGEVIWVITDLDFGSALFPIDITPDGELIMLDAGSADNQSTIGDQVAQYAIESELDTPSAISEAPIARLESQLNWQISAVDCSIVYCHKRLSPQGVLYIFQDYPVRKLYVLQPDGTPPIEHDLTSAGQLIMGRIDFVPFDDLQAVIFFADAGDPITLARYELATGQISDFSLPLVNRISLCNRSSWFLSTLPYAISQIGLDDQLLVCTYSTDSGAQINVVDVSNQTVLQSINLGTQATGGRFDPPWGSLIGGADGNIYLESSFPPPTLYDQFPELQTLDVSSSGFLFRFSLPDNQWRFQVRSAAAENLYPLRYVDAKGNLYTVAERPLMLYEHSFVLTRLDHQFRLLSRIPQGTFDPNTRFLGATLNGDVVLVHEEELIVRQISEFDLFPMATATP